MWIRTTTAPYLYVHQLHGVCFISWLFEEDKVNALFFPPNKAKEWLRIISDMANIELECVHPFA